MAKQLDTDLSARSFHPLACLNANSVVEIRATGIADLEFFSASDVSFGCSARRSNSRQRKLQFPA
jgi:hypothetical protein